MVTAPPRKSKISFRRIDLVLFFVCLAVLGVTIAYPTLRLLIEAIAQWQPDALARKGGWTALRNTAFISVLSVICAGIVGTALALALARFAFPGRRVLAALAYLPFTLPPLVGVVSFYYIIGRDGFIPRFLEQRLGWRTQRWKVPARSCSSTRIRSSCFSMRWFLRRSNRWTRRLQRPRARSAHRAGVFSHASRCPSCGPRWSARLY